MSKEKTKIKKESDLSNKIDKINFELTMIRESLEVLNYRKSLPKFRFYISSDVARTSMVLLGYLVAIKYIFLS
jgi:hypothetical protein